MVLHRRAQQCCSYEPVTIQQASHARHRALQGMSVSHSHHKSWNFPRAPAISNGPVPHHQGMNVSH